MEVETAMMRSIITAAALAMLTGVSQAQTATDPETGLAPPGSRVAPGQESTIDARRPNTTGSVGREETSPKAPEASPPAPPRPTPLPKRPASEPRAIR